MVCGWYTYDKKINWFVSVKLHLTEWFLSHVHVRWIAQIVPLIYDLLIEKNATAYDQFFQLIMGEDDCNSVSVLTTLESRTIKSVKTMFPHASSQRGYQTYSSRK